jgi:hypothetical protein
MALQIEANYSKKIGLPGYSSHQFSITVKAELSDISQVEAESSRLYALLQTSVDRELQQQGYVPGAENNGQAHQVDHSRAANFHQNGNARTNGHIRNGHQGNGRFRQSQQRNGFHNRINIQVREEQWKCSPKQQELILKMVHEHQLDKNYVEQLSMQLFGIGVRSLNKLQASGLIDEVIREVEQNQNQPATAGGHQ